MKLGVAALLSAGQALLVACGSGSVGGPGPTPTPISTSGPGSYKVSILWSGGDALASQSRQRNVVRTHALDVRRTLSSAPGQLPVIMPVDDPSNSYFSNDNGIAQGIATVIVSPQPSAEPTATYGVSGASAVASPLPVASPGSTAPPEASVSADTLTTQTGTLGVTLTGSVNQSVNVPIYIVGRFNVACSSTPLSGPAGPQPADQVGGVAFTGGQVSAVATTGAADFYIDGATCTSVGFVNPSDPNPTFYAPYGAVQVSSTQTPYAQLTPAQWSNAFTSISAATLEQDALDPTTPLNMLLIQTASGKVVKIALNAIGGSPVTVCDCSFEQDGFAQDGF